MRRDPLPDAGIRIIFLTELPADSAERIHCAASSPGYRPPRRPVAARTVILDGRTARLNDAVRAALDDRSHPLVLITTAVEPWSPAHLEPLLEAIDRCDHVVGRRPAGTWRRLTRWIGCLARRLIFAVPVLRRPFAVPAPPPREARGDSASVRLVVPRHRDPGQGDIPRPPDR